uniref:Complex 1 LYR protein domain-containing protein n=1 Tax=Ditylum brightwellii TaxID=49249 RepID=A0A6S9GUG5_9STRA|mmetsp:Transcript_5782/g.7515  ORF Transcript_5782/g.7515 Transcript_5782/m.7515 type:complete len:104 (+) Transcript_5782:90-401(+)
MSVPAHEGGKALLFLYRRLLRSCATYPSKNRLGIYEAIREEFRENVSLDPEAYETKQKIAVAYKGLTQLRMYDEVVLSKGNPNSPNWEVTLEQNPMPKPPNLE